MARKTGDECRFRQRDLQVAIRAAKNAGLENFRIEISRNGTITVVPMAPGESVPDKQRDNEWDDDL
jgi:hypothetical protein